MLNLRSIAFVAVIETKDPCHFTKIGEKRVTVERKRNIMFQSKNVNENVTRNHCFLSIEIWFLDLNMIRVIEKRNSSKRLNSKVEIKCMTIDLVINS